MPGRICHFWCRCRLAVRSYSSKILIEDFLLLAMHCNVYRTVTLHRVFTNWMVQFRKLTRNLFLTLHGQNVHRLQRQLSKFLMRYQQFASHAYCGAAGSVSKMAPQQVKAFCVLRFEVSRSVITVQREFRAARFRKDAPCMGRLF